MPNINKIPTINRVAKGLSKLQNSSAILPVALIETTVIAGRSYQGLKRGGKDEFRERLIEETISAGFWLFGIVGLSKLGSYIGKNWLNLKNLDADTGKDALRDSGALLDKTTKKFKLSKIALSTAIAVGFVGFVLPKINQKITKNVIKKDQDKQIKSMPVMKMDKFMQMQQPVNQTSFKGAGSLDFVAKACHNLENNNVWRLITTDVGITGGRVGNSRNKYEAREYLFRDVAATYFYMFATPHVMNGLFKATKTSKVHPEALLEIQKHLLDKVKNQEFSADEFMSKTLDKTIAKDTLDKIKFNENGVVKLSALENILDGTKFKKAAKMSCLQPKLYGERILSEMQVEDVLAENWLNEPSFLFRTIKKATYGLSNKKTKFVSQKTCEKARKSVDEFAQSLIDYAKSNNKTINKITIEQFTKRNITLNAVFTTVGFAASIFGLSFLIPKVQQYMTYKATGKDAFPGTQNYA